MDKGIIRITVIGCVACFILGIFAGMLNTYILYEKQIEHYNNCQEKALQDSISELRDHIDDNTLHLCNDTSDEVTARQIRNYFKK